MMTDGYIERLVGAVASASLLYAVESDDSFVRGLRHMRVGLTAILSARFPEIPEDVAQIVEQSIVATATRRHAIRIGAGILPPHGTMQ
jgi:hypothetical protein